MLKNVSAEVKDGEFFTLVGESGCGKSTLLRIIAGLENADSGQVKIKSRDVSFEDPKQRNVAMVFQDYALYPHMPVKRNLAMPLLMSMTSVWQRIPLIRLVDPNRRKVKVDIDLRINKVAEQLKISHLLARKPSELSGGQRQRVALGRALVRNPDIFLMDEPLSNLDAKLRESVRTEITQLYKSSGLTFVYVTHDQTEAMTMSSTVGLIHNGEFLQIGSPNQLYSMPNNLTVARFIGSPEINVLSLELFPEFKKILSQKKNLSAINQSLEDFQLGIRPEKIRTSTGTVDAMSSKEPSNSLAASLQLNVMNIEDLGHEYLINLIKPPAQLVRT